MLHNLLGFGCLLSSVYETAAAWLGHVASSIAYPWLSIVFGSLLLLKFVSQIDCQIVTAWVLEDGPILLAPVVVGAISLHFRIRPPSPLPEQTT